MPETFQAWVAREKDRPCALETLDRSELPAGDVLVRVAYSSLNYKDALALTARGKIVRQFPLIPGVDLAGFVEASNSPLFRVLDRVVLTGSGIGELRWGGLSQLARVSADGLLPLPQEFTFKQAMAIGTAGFTAMLSILALEEHAIAPPAEVLVTGATGGVGSLAVAMLAKRGYIVTASTGKKDAANYLKSLGATTILDRSLLSKESKPLESEHWKGAIDTVGGTTLATVLASISPHGSVATCGLAGDHQLKTTVYPFILRGVNLLGIDSNWCTPEQRRKIWRRLTLDLPLKLLDSITQEISLKDAHAWSETILQGAHRGRIVVKID